MKFLLYFLVTLFFITSCSSIIKTTKSNITHSENLIKIAKDSLEYKIIIMDAGFETYLNSIAKPVNFYSKEYYETKNKLYVAEWNMRAQYPIQYSCAVYKNNIDYYNTIDYGLDLNYKLYNYFKFVEYKYKQHFFN